MGKHLTNDFHVSNLTQPKPLKDLYIGFLAVIPALEFVKTLAISPGHPS